MKEETVLSVTTQKTHYTLSASIKLSKEVNVLIY